MGNTTWTSKLFHVLDQYECIACVGGGSGGHTQPILSLIEKFRQENREKDFLWIGGRKSMESEKAREARIPFYSIATTKLETTRSWRIFLYPFGIFRGFLRARKILQKKRQEYPNLCVFSKGGPGSIAVGLATWSLGIPLYIHESDTIPGQANRYVWYFATRIFLGFAEAWKYFPAWKSEVIGQILHPIFLEHRENTTSIAWRTHLPHILVICGSQGSRAIFTTLLQDWKKFPKAEWIIALGTKNTEFRSDFLELNKSVKATEWGFVHVYEWLPQEAIASLVRDCDLAITRASATTLAELTSSEQNPIRLIIIPLPFSARDHQLENARVYEKQWYALLEQKDITELASTVIWILE